MENQQEQPNPQKEEKIETDNKKPISSDIEPIEKIQPSHKIISNFDKKKNFHQNKGHFHNYHQNHNNNYSSYSNSNIMGKNRTNSEKYNRIRYPGSNYNKNNYNDPRNKNYKFAQKKRNQDSYYNNDHTHQRNTDEKLEFINPYIEAEKYDKYNDFDKLPNLNFLKQNAKQKRFPEEEEKEIKNNLAQNNAFPNIQNQNILFNQMKMLSQFNLGKNNLNILNFLNNNNNKLNNYKQMLNNILQNNNQNANKGGKNNNQLFPNLLNFPLNLNNNPGISNLNSNQMNGINSLNNPINNNNNTALLLNKLINSNNQLKNLSIQQQQNANNKLPIQIPNQQLDNNVINNINHINNKSPQKLNQINNQNSLNDNMINLNNLNMINSDKINSSMNSLIQAYFKSLQYQQIILNKMTQLFTSPTNNINNIHNDIQQTVSQLKNNISTEISQISTFQGITNNQTDNKNNSNESNENKENKNNNNNIKENDKSDKYIQNILSSWPEQKFYKPYSPLLKLEKNQSSLKPANLLNNSIFANPSLNINTMSMPYSNLGNQSLILKAPDYQKKDIYDEQKITELLKEGKCLTGIFRMNQQHNHGYITVQGIDNDILIRGKNLYECLNLDEVIIELIDFNKWKPFLNKNRRKFSHVNDDSQINNSTKYIKDEESFKTKEDRLKYISEKMKDRRPEGKIIKILRSPNQEKQQICTIIVEKNLIMAKPIDDTIPKILINIRNLSKKLITNIDTLQNRYILSYFPNDFEKDYKNYKKKYFFVKIHSFVSNNIHKGPIGYIVSEIGASGNIDVESDVLLNLNNVNYNENFSDDIMNEVKKKLNELKITDEYIKSTKRADFRNELVFTIDPYTSKDLDDAIHVKVIDKETQLLEIGVHIADPTSYIDVDSLLDKEALNRATSVYLVQKKIPMLPLILSDDVCSIMPGKDTLSISCIFRIYLANGSLDKNFDPYFTLSVVNSRAKWDYDLVQKLIEKKEVKYEDLKFEDGTKPKSEEIFNELKNSVDILYKLTKLVRKERFDSGSLMIEQGDIKFDLDEKTQMPIDFHLVHENDAHSLIEELMLISNLLCAKFIYSHLKKYALIRRHPFFNDKNYGEIQRYFAVNKIYSGDFEDTIELNEILKNLKEKNNKEYICVQQKLKMLLLRAEYIFAGKLGQDDLRHSSLNYDLYTHFTSPIRRYPDMIVHRQLKEIFKFETTMKPEKSAYKKFEKYISYIDHINKRYNSARIISLKSKRLFQCLYLKNAQKKKYSAIIMDINSINNSNKKANNNSLGNNFMNNWNNNANNNNDEDEIVLSIFVPELNMEVEWRKSDNENILFFSYNKEKNDVYIDYKHEESGIQNRYLKNFDSIQVELFSLDSVPIDAKCKIDFSK